MPRQERLQSATGICHVMLVMKNDNGGTPLMWRFNGGYVELNANGAPTSWNYYVTDHLGSTRMVVDSNDSIKEVINYCPFGSDFLFENGQLSKFLFEGGYATIANGQPTYHYYTKDHLGNNRAVVNHNGTIEQVVHYYPFGAVYSDAGTADALQRYKYNGKELDRMHGLNQYDYGARNYDPLMCRFTQMDPLAENYYNVSPYAYCANNPINAVDYEGKRIIFVQGYLVGRPSGEKYWGGRHSSFVVGAQKYFNDYSQPFFTNNDLSYWDSSTFSRFNKGYNYAKNNYADITNGMSSDQDVFYIISHSMGGEFSEGMANYLIEKGWNVSIMMHFNAWQPTEMYGTEGPIRVDLTTTNDPVQLLSLPINGNSDIPNSNYKIRKKSDKPIYYRHADLISNGDVWEGKEDWNSIMQTIREWLFINPCIKIE